jgi:hypothetical protein
MTEWLTININPPKLGKPIAVRTADFLGFGRSFDILEFDSSVMNQDEFASYLEAQNFIEWLELPE